MGLLSSFKATIRRKVNHYMVRSYTGSGYEEVGQSDCRADLKNKKNACLETVFIFHSSMRHANPCQERHQEGLEPRLLSLIAHNMVLKGCLN